MFKRDVIRIQTCIKWTRTTFFSVRAKVRKHHSLFEMTLSQDVSNFKQYFSSSSYRSIFPVHVQIVGVIQKNKWSFGRSFSIKNPFRSRCKLLLGNFARCFGYNGAVSSCALFLLSVIVAMLRFCFIFCWCFSLVAKYCAGPKFNSTEILSLVRCLNLHFIIGWTKVGMLENIKTVCKTKTSEHHLACGTVNGQ